MSDCFNMSVDMKRLNHLLAETDAVYHQAAWKIGLSDSAMNVLYTLCSLGEHCLLCDLVRLSGISKQTINSALRKLESEGILYLESMNRKKKTVCLTDKGKDLVQKTVAKIIRIENEVFDSWTEEERRMYVELARKYCMCLKEKVKEL